MKKVTQTLLLLCIGCGGLDKVTQSGSGNHYPCTINLSYDSTRVSENFDVPRFVAREYSESCKDYLGANIQTLRYRLNVQTRESVGTFDQISIDGRHVSLASYSLANRNIVIDDIDTSSVDNGPLQMEHIWVTFVFPQNAEKGLYPQKIELIITNRT